MYNQPVETFIGEAELLVDDGPQLVYWLFMEPATIATKGTLKIYDGVSTQGKEVARIVTGYGRMHSFFPPIRCSVGLYIYIGVAGGIPLNPIFYPIIHYISYYVPITYKDLC